MVPLAPSGVPLGSLGRPLGQSGTPWTALGRLLDFVENWTSLSEQMGRISAACAQNIASRNSPGDPGDPPDPGDPGEVVARSAVRSPTSTRAGGQDDVSFTNSLKL